MLSSCSAFLMVPGRLPKIWSFAPLCQCLPCITACHRLKHSHSYPVCLTGSKHAEPLDIALLIRYRDREDAEKMACLSHHIIGRFDEEHLLHSDAFALWQSNTESIGAGWSWGWLKHACPVASLG